MNSGAMSNMLDKGTWEISKESDLPLKGFLKGLKKRKRFCGCGEPMHRNERAIQQNKGQRLDRQTLMLA